MFVALAERWLKKVLRWLLRFLVGCLGTRVVGTAQKLWVWGRGKAVWVFPDPSAPEHGRYVRAQFRSCGRVRYGWQELEFAPWPLPDARRAGRALQVLGAEPEYEGKVLCAVLCHGGAEQAQAIVRQWQRCGWQERSVLLVHGGAEADFDSLAHWPKVFVEDERLRRNPAPLRKQSYGGVLQAVANYLAVHKEFQWVLLAEYDLLPLWEGLAEGLVQVAKERKADVMCHHLQRVDGTNAPHYCYHLHDPAFLGAWREISCRGNPEEVLNALMVGSLWRREAWLETAGTHLPTEVYLEMELPTTAHHLGYRVVPYPQEWSRWVTASPQRGVSLLEVKRAGGKWLHPWKKEVAARWLEEDP